jgi:hypothetical protein
MLFEVLAFDIDANRGASGHVYLFQGCGINMVADVDKLLKA